MPGRTLGRYEIIEKIDQGGMAEVFKARQVGPHGFEKIVAIKRILPHLISNRDFVEMFTSEAKVMAQLQHQNIVQIYDFGFDDGHYYIAMEYTHGINLNDLALISLDSKARIPIPMINHVIKNVCSALDHAHTKTDARGKHLKIVHRDVNPKNIMILFSGEIKLMDFGIALATNRGFETIADGMIKGKISYLSPEQVKSAEIDHRSDLFSLGIVYYELITGEKPFQSDSEFGIMTKISEGSITPISRLVKNIPDEIIQIIMKCLAKDKQARYQTAAAIRSDIEKFEIKSNWMINQTDFRKYLEGIIGIEIIGTSAVSLPGGENEETVSADDLELGKEPPRPAKPRRLEDSYPVIPKSAANLPQKHDVSDQVGAETPSHEKDSDLALDLGSEWIEKKGLFEKFRAPIIILFLLVLTGSAATFVFGVKGLLRIVGFYNPAYESSYTVTRQPDDSLLEFDFVSHLENPSHFNVKWDFGSRHQIKVSHPAYRDSIIQVIAPPDENSEPVFEGLDQPGIVKSDSPGTVNLEIKLVPNYIKLQIKSKPSEAKVYINNIDTQKVTPFEFDFPTDKESELRIEKNGYVTIVKKITPEPFKKPAPIDVQLEKAKSTPTDTGTSRSDKPKAEPTATPVPSFGSVRIHSQYPVDVYTGRKKLASGVTSKEIKLPVGKNTLSFKNPSLFLDVTKTLTITKNKAETINMEPIGTMFVDSDPPGATVSIDQTVIGTAPGKYELAPGTYNVIFTWQQCNASQSVWVRVTAQQNKRVPKVTGCK